jgi:nicotinamidase-related amidase
MSRPRRALIIVDMSVEQMSAIEYNAKQVIRNCVKLASNQRGVFHLVVDSKLWLQLPSESSLSWVWPETAKTMFKADSEGASLISELREIKGLIFVPKNNYSCFAKSNLLESLRQQHIQEVYICGINTDYCVFATALDSFQNQFRTFVVTDAVTSVRGKDAHEEGLRNLERHFGAGVFVSTDEVMRIDGVTV